MQSASGTQGISGLVKKNFLALLWLLTAPPHTHTPLPLLVSLCYKTYDSSDFKPLLLLIDSAIDDNTISPSLTQECIGEDTNCPSFLCGPHASGFNHCVHSDSTIWLAQLETHDQFHDQSLLCLLAELKCDRRTSRKRPIRTTRTREEHIPEVNVGVCYYGGYECETCLVASKQLLSPQSVHFIKSNHFC